MTLTASSDASAGALFQSTAAKFGISIQSLGQLAQLQLVLASIMTDEPPGAVAAGDIAAGTFGSGIPDSGAYLFPSAITVGTTITTTLGGLTMTTPANTVDLTITGGGVTGSNTTSTVAITDIWNTSGVVTGISYAVTDTARGAGSLLLNLLAGSAGTTSMFSVSNIGAIVSPAGITILSVSAGATPASVGTTPGTAAPTLPLATNIGGATSIATTGAGGKGGDASITTGAGGTAALAATAGTGGAGGDFSLTTGAGAASAVTGTGTGTGGKGGAIALTTGIGGATSVSTGVNVGGASGAIALATAAGGASTNGSSNTGGASGVITIATGAGGTGATAQGNSGSITLSTGATTGTAGSIILAPAGVTAITAAATVTITPATQITGALTLLAGALSSSAALGIGYKTGAGGVVTQASNRSTVVTCNTVVGQITGNAASLAASTSATFTVINTTVAATDLILLSVVSGPTANTSIFSIGSVGSGLFTIRAENIATVAGDVGAPVLNFAVIKGAIS